VKSGDDLPRYPARRDHDLSQGAQDPDLACRLCLVAVLMGHCCAVNTGDRSRPIATPPPQKRCGSGQPHRGQRPRHRDGGQTRLIYIASENTIANQPRTRGRPCPRQPGATGSRRSEDGQARQIIPFGWSTADVPNRRGRRQIGGYLKSI